MQKELGHVALIYGPTGFSLKKNNRKKNRSKKKSSKVNNHENSAIKFRRQI